MCIQVYINFKTKIVSNLMFIILKIYFNLKNVLCFCENLVSVSLFNIFKQGFNTFNVVTRFLKIKKTNVMVEF